MIEQDDGRGFRQALGGFATGVALIAADTAQGVAGIVVNSFTSVSLTPRLVLWCLGDASDRYGAFSEAERWSANVLGVGQQAVSARVARPGGHDISDLSIARLHGAPVLDGAIAQLSCRTRERLTMGDHLVIVGDVEGYAASAGDGLLYFRGRYGRAVTEA
ncbi:MAG: flavin reductase family protein [Hyphomonadaceae bacterium]|nr:flavin reductase family protein [Hyphomonadaceae bacterium]